MTASTGIVSKLGKRTATLKCLSLGENWLNGYGVRLLIFGQKFACVDAIIAHYDADFNSPRHFPGLAEDLSNFPPTYIVCAEKDCFRDDGKILDFRLRESGVKSKLDFYDGLPHYFHGTCCLGGCFSFH